MAGDQNHGDAPFQRHDPWQQFHSSNAGQDQIDQIDQHNLRRQLSDQIESEDQRKQALGMAIRGYREAMGTAEGSRSGAG